MSEEDARLPELAEALREAENRFQALMENIVDGLIVIDDEGIIHNFNPAAERIFGYPARDVIGHSVNALMPELESARHDGYIADYMRTGEARIIGFGREVTGLRRDGTTFPMDLSVAEMPVRGRRYFVGTIRDISARREMESQLRQAHKMDALGQLTGGVAHDFNNLLAILMMDLELLDEMTAGQEELSELVREAREVARSGADLTQRLLAFSRRQALEPKVIDLNVLVASAAGMLRRTLGEAIEIDIVGPSDLWHTLADPGQVETALLNLAINARDAMPEGGRLTITASNGVLDDDYVALEHDLEPGEYVLLSITDTGTGMTPEVLERVFDPFFSTKAAGAGSGLGLSMVYGFVKQSGGHVAIYSEPGLGTTVNIYLPKAATEDEAARSRRPAPRRAAGNETILLVEDHAQLRRRARQVLDGLGYIVIEAEDGDVALAVLGGELAIDLLFTDIVMPGTLDGRALAQQARGLRPGLKVLFTTGYAAQTRIAADLPETDYDVLHKPYATTELADKIRRLIDSR